MSEGKGKERKHAEISPRRKGGEDVVLAALSPSAVSKLASLHEAPAAIIGLGLKSLGPGTLRSLEEHDVVRVERSDKAPHRALLVDLTTYGRRVVAAAAAHQADRMLVDSCLPQARDDSEPEIAVGIDVGHYGLRVGLVTRLGEIVHLTQVEDDIPLIKPMDRILESVADAVNSAVSQSDVDVSRIRGAVVGIPAPVDPTGTKILSNSFLPGWGEGNPVHRLRTLLEDRTKYPWALRLGNDANLSAVGQLQYGAAKGHRNVAFVKVSAGIGAGLILEGALYRGTRGVAGEFGHCVVSGHPRGRDSFSSAPDVPYCDYCAQWGCLEKMASSEPVLAEIGEDGNARAIFEEASSVDAPLEYKNAVANAAAYLAVAVQGITHLLDLELIVVGGIMSHARETLINPLQKTVENINPEIRVMAVDNPATAVVLGAATAVFRDGPERADHSRDSSERGPIVYSLDPARLT